MGMMATQRMAMAVVALVVLLNLHSQIPSVAAADSSHRDGMNHGMPGNKLYSRKQLDLQSSGGDMEVDLEQPLVSGGVDPAEEEEIRAVPIETSDVDAGIQRLSDESAVPPSIYPGPAIAMEPFKNIIP